MLRELLLKVGCRIDLWWERSSAHRYRIVRGRLRIADLDCEFDPSAHFDTNAITYRMMRRPKRGAEPLTVAPAASGPTNCRCESFSIDSSAVSVGKIDGRRLANIVLPTPVAQASECYEGLRRRWRALA